MTPPRPKQAPPPVDPLALRQRYGLSQAGFARLLGCHSSLPAQWERGHAVTAAYRRILAVLSVVPPSRIARSPWREQLAEDPESAFFTLIAIGQAGRRATRIPRARGAPPAEPS